MGALKQSRVARRATPIRIQALTEGMIADINVIDFDGLRLHRPEAVFDLPAGGRRLVQRAEGYEITIKSGEVIFNNGQHSGALPGKLVRRSDAQGVSAAS